MTVPDPAVHEDDALVSRDLPHDRLRARHLLQHGLAIVDAQKPVDPALQVQAETQCVVCDPHTVETLLLREEVREGKKRHQERDGPDEDGPRPEGHDFSCGLFCEREETALLESRTRTLSAISTVRMSSATPVTRPWMPPFVTT